jgi:methyl-accepting chemotaxis protein
MRQPYLNISIPYLTESKMNFSNFKIANRLLIGFGSVLALLVFSLAIAISQLSSLRENVDSLANDRIPKINLGNAWIFQLMETARHTRNMLILTDHEQIQKEVDAVYEDKRLRTEYLTQLQKVINLPEGIKLLQNVIDARASYNPLEDDYLKLVGAGDIANAKDLLLNKARPAQLLYIQELEKLNDFEKDAAKKSGIKAENDYATSRNILITLGIGAALLSIFIGIFITRGLLKQLGGEPNDAADIAGRIAHGDLTVHVEVNANDQSSLMYAMKTMRDKLLEIVGEVRSGTDLIASASSEIANGNLDLSSRTEQQAASLEETASSMEELTATVKQNADNSRQANQLATTASEVAVKGGAVVGQVVGTMSAINESAKKIADIIGVIDGIAFQTNILALNAAVEAARAGEQGRGFAVVATEVRNLAQRSAAAAKEIKELINDSVEKVDAGSRLVNEAGATMAEVVASVKRVSNVINEITVASNEQASGIDQINQAITQMDEVTQQNASLVEEAAAAAGSLQEQAKHLVNVVKVFKADDAMSITSATPKSSVTPSRRSDQVVKISSTSRHPPRPSLLRNSAPKLAAAGGNANWEEF